MYDPTSRRWLAATLVLSLVVACKGERREPPATRAAQVQPSRAEPLREGPVAKEWPFRLDAEPAVAEQAMVATDSPQATTVGLEVLADGGNAVDAAVAVLFALAVTFPEAGSLGGGGFAVVVGPDGEAAALDFRETAPAAATADMYLGADGKTTDRSITGALAAGVPGNVRGMWELHKKYGSKPWADLLAPAIRLAGEGFPIGEAFAKVLAMEAPRLAKYPASAAIYLPDGKPLAAGTVLKNPDLEKTLRRIATQGADEFYTGETARLTVAEMKRSGGIMTLEDLAGYKAVWRKPVWTKVKDHTIYSMPPPSSGGVAVVELANILFDMPDVEWHSPEHLHRTAEAMRRVFADRNRILADPDFVKVEQELLTSREYAEKHRQAIRRDAVTPSTAIQPGLGLIEGLETTHYSIVDEKGGAIAVTTTINMNYGSAVTVTGAGYLLNDEMDDFTANLKQANAFGLAQGRRNVIEPGKRPLSSMAPTIVVGPDGKVRLVTGARGGGRIITAVYQIVENVVYFDMDVMAAVAAPRIHHQHLPDQLFYEKDGLTASQKAALERLGHELAVQEPRGSAPTIVRSGGRWTGTQDPRREGKAAGY